MSIRNRISRALAVGLLFFAGGPRLMAGVVVDDFDTPAIIATITSFSGPNPVSHFLPPSDSVFEQRTTSAAGSATIVNIGAGQVAEIVVSGPGSASLSYFNGPTLGLSNGSYSDLSLDGADRFFIDLNSVSLAATEPNLELFVNGFSSGSISLDATALSDVISVPFSAFGVLVDFSSVYSFIATISFTTAASVSIDSITTGTPEPTTVVVWSMVSIAALGWVSLRRSSSLGRA